MKIGSRVAGFTIVETLIVLSVTGFLFVIAAAAIGGKQNATEFSQGVRDVQSRVQKVMNEVSSGFYPNTGNFSCSGAAGEPVLSNLSNTDQGANKDCLFLGKVIQFAADPGSSGAEPFNVYSLTGLRQDSSGNLATSLAATKPRLIARGSGDLASVPDIYDAQTMPYGLTVASMYYNTPANPIWAVGFISKLDAVGSADASQQVDVIAIPAVSHGATKDDGVKQINLALKPPAGPVYGVGGVVKPELLNPSAGVFVCLKSGTTDQSALMTIGGQGRQSSVDISIKSTADCT